MGDPSVTLRRPGEGSVAYVEGLLEDEDLPSMDVRSKPECFYVGYAGGERVGIGGLEVYGSDGLLRSLVVEPDFRGEGYGSAICEAVEAEARDAAVDTLYLLTTTAANFFSARGYDVIPRSDAPAAIRQTSEFDELCPSTAACLTKSL